MATKKVQSHARKHNSLEAVNEFGGAVAQSLKQDIGKEGAKDFIQQLLGISSSEKAANQPVEQPAKETTNGLIELFNVGNHETTKKNAAAEKYRKPEQYAAIDYKNEVTENKISKKELREMNGQVQEIMAELKKLIYSSKVLQVEFAEVTVDQAPPQVGQYHVNFLEWMLLVVRTARQKVEDSGAWLATVKGKNSKGHWNKISQKGANTHVTLSNERTASTQTG